ncbi:hypothetical protein [Kitasatospora sp. NPDC001175]|uniref:hypothetical protein n=1 Tax=Kitasatospora sp. NPDC001175 TaxID=3157103 RepID=UPI003D0457B6
MTTSPNPGPDAFAATTSTTAVPPMSWPGRATVLALIDTHHSSRPHAGTDRGEALDELALIIGSTVDELDRTVADSERLLNAAHKDLDTIAAGGALTPCHAQPALAATGASLDILAAITGTLTHQLRFLARAYQRLNTAAPAEGNGTSDL